jgi:hypothetical protein
VQAHRHEPALQRNSCPRYVPPLSACRDILVRPDGAAALAQLAQPLDGVAGGGGDAASAAGEGSLLSSHLRTFASKSPLEVGAASPVGTS